MSWLQRNVWWRFAKHPPALVVSEPVDSRYCGLQDAVLSGWFQNSSNELFKGFSISPEDTVVDVGCGGGQYSEWAAARGAEVIFTDIVAEKIEQLRKQIGTSTARSVRGLVCDSSCLPIDSNTATKVMCLEVLEHVPDPSLAMRELARIGKPGSLYLLSVPDARAEKIQQPFAPAAYFQEPNHIHIFEREDFAQLVTQAGLVVQSHTTYGFFWSMWMMMYWVWAQSHGLELEGESLDVVNSPCPELLNDWARVWSQLINLPNSGPLKAQLDNLLPKSQLIVARKPVERS